MLEYILTAAVSGVAWSALQFIDKVADKAKGERWKDFDVLRTVKTVLFNAVGGAALIWAANELFGLEYSYSLAVAAGIYGEKGLDVVVNALGRMLSAITK